LLAEWEKRYPHLMRKLVAAMEHVDAQRLLDPRFLDLDVAPAAQTEPKAETAPLTAPVEA